MKKDGINFTGADTPAELPAEWDETAAMIEKTSAGNAAFMGEAKALRTCAKELRGVIAAGSPALRQPDGYVVHFSGAMAGPAAGHNGIVSSVCDHESALSLCGNDSPLRSVRAIYLDLPPDDTGLLEAIRALPAARAPEFDGEEADGTPIRWRSRPHVSLTQLERLLVARGIVKGAAA